MPAVYLKSPLARLLEFQTGFIPVTRFPWIIGRHPDCDLTVSIPLLSRYHCQLFLCGDEVWVRDLASRNGTRLNGKPLTLAWPLRDGDRLILAGVPFDVRIAGRSGTRLARCERSAANGAPLGSPGDSEPPLPPRANQTLPSRFGDDEPNR